MSTMSPTYVGTARERASLQPQVWKVPPPDYMLTQKLLRQQVQGGEPLYWLLQQLLTDSIFTFKEEFTNGISDNFWVNGGFRWEPEDLQGHIFGTAIGEEDEHRPHTGLSLRGRVFGWQPGKRCSMMARIQLASLGGKVEFGFVDDHIKNALNGAVQSQSTPSTYDPLEDFTVATRSGTIADTYTLVTLGEDNAIGTSTSDKTVAIGPAETLPEDARYEHSLMIATNEQTETYLWVDGQATDIERSGPKKEANLAPWIFAQDTGLTVHYVQLWQERKAV